MFIQFDSSSFYSTNNPIVLNKALWLAHNKAGLIREEINVLLATRKMLPVRKDTPDGYDVTMGSSDSAQIADLVGIYILYEMADQFPSINGGLYRD